MLPLLPSHTVKATLHLIFSIMLAMHILPAGPVPVTAPFTDSQTALTQELPFVGAGQVAADQQAAADKALAAAGGVAGQSTGGLQPAFKPVAASPAVQAAAANAVNAKPAVKPAAPAPQPTPQPQPATGGFPWHTVRATMFWAGEDASEDNGFITNAESAWMGDWVAAFGGIDDPNCRNGWNPCGFTPLENPFYFALPFGDYTASGMKSNLNVIPWYTGPVASGQSILKNRWVQVTANGKSVYAQWEDVGPFKTDDHAYVFGTAAPQYSHAGIDLSPAADAYLGLHGSGTVSWRFVEAADVPSGPWRAIITTSAPNW